jgi:RNA polymerase sigma factor (TIGR02999 family)
MNRATGAASAESPSLPLAGQVTDLLVAWRQGDRAAEHALVGLIYPLLRNIAAGEARRNAGLLTMGPTELLNEAYERLFVDCDIACDSRAHFYAVAASVIRHVVIDHLRTRSAEKRGGGLGRVSLDQLDGSEPEIAVADTFDLLILDQALTELAAHDPVSARVIELRVFSGLSIEQIATTCGSSVATVGRQLRFARAWLAQHLEPGR